MSVCIEQRSLVQTILSRCIRDLQVDVDKLSIDSPDTKGDAYIGTLLFIKVNEAINFVIKISTEDADRRRFIDPAPLFERERYFYTVFYPAMEEYQKEKLGEQLVSSVPRCYGTFFEQQIEALVFEDLKEAGYKLWDRKVPMDESHVSLVLEEYGKLHAVSLAMRHQNPELFRRVTDCIKGSDVFSNIVRKVRVSSYDKFFERAVMLFKNRGHEEVAKRLNNFRDEIPDVLLRYAGQSDAQSVVIHGDAWCNNIMFKYEDGHHEPSSLRFVDFQISKLASPLLDFSFFFYSCAPQHILENVEKYLRIYHKSINRSLEQLGCEPGKLFPFAVLRKHWRKYGKFGLVISVCLFRATLCDSDEAPNLTDDKFFDDIFKPIRNEEEVNRRIIDVVMHFVNNNII